MNRNQVRKLRKKGYSDKLIMSRYRQEVHDQGFDNGVRHTYRMLLLITAYILRDQLGLGQKRLGIIMSRILNTIDCFNTKNLTPSDLHLMASELKAIGFDIEKYS